MCCNCDRLLCCWVPSCDVRSVRLVSFLCAGAFYWPKLGLFGSVVVCIIFMVHTSLGVECIWRAAAARRLGVTAMMVTKYVRLGMPTREDKRVPWPEAREWREQYVNPERSGSWKFRQRRQEVVSGLAKVRHPGGPAGHKDSGPA